MTPNSLGSPDSSQELAAVLDKIAEIEATPGFDGPRIWGKIQIFRKQAFQGGWSQDHLEDRIVGEIGRSFGGHYASRKDSYEHH